MISDLVIAVIITVVFGALAYMKKQDFDKLAPTDAGYTGAKHIYYALVVLTVAMTGVCLYLYCRQSGKISVPGFGAGIGAESSCTLTSL